MVSYVLDCSIQCGAGEDSVSVDVDTLVSGFHIGRLFQLVTLFMGLNVPEYIYATQ